MAQNRKGSLPIGIHISGSGVHMAQLEVADDGLRLVSKARQEFDPLPLPARDEAGENPETTPAWQQRQQDAHRFVLQTLTGDGFRGKEVVLALPTRELEIQHVRMGPMQPDELATSLPWELQGKLPFDPRAAVIRHLVAGAVTENNETKQDIIAMAALRSSVEQMASEVERLGLRVVGVGCEPCAMGTPYAYAAAHRPPDQQGPRTVMLVYPGSHATHVAIVKGPETVFVKEIQVGVEHLVRAMAKAREAQPTEVRQMRKGWCDAGADGPNPDAVKAYNTVGADLDHLCDALAECMRYHASLARGAQLDQVLFVGPEARDGALVQVLGARLRVAAEPGDPVAAVTGRPGDGGSEPELAVALGLSLFGAA